MTAPVLDPQRLAPEPRPSLRVVTPAGDRDRDRDKDADRRRLVRTMAVLIAGGLAVCIFGIVVAHVVLTQNQFRLDDLQDQALERQAEYDRLRLQVAELESPDRIVADAQQRLGMVAAPKITYLSPTVEDTPGAERAQVTADEAASGGTDWSVVKPHLADG